MYFLKTQRCFYLNTLRVKSELYFQFYVTLPDTNKIQNNIPNQAKQNKIVKQSPISENLIDERSDKMTTQPDNNYFYTLLEFHHNICSKSIPFLHNEEDQYECKQAFSAHKIPNEHQTPCRNIINFFLKRRYH